MVFVYKQLKGKLGGVKNFTAQGQVPQECLVGSG